MGDIINKLNEIKDDALNGDNASVIDKLNILIAQLEIAPEIEIAPAQEDLLPVSNEKQILITGNNAHVRIYMAKTSEK